MSTMDPVELAVAEWLTDEAAFRLPDHLGEVVSATAATRQRPAWSSLERWLPMDLTSRASPLASPRLGRVIVVALVIAALVGLAILAVGSRQHRVPPPFGPARNGELLSSGNGDIFRVDPRTGERTPLITGSTFDFGPTFSRDGTKILFLRGAPSDCGKYDCGQILATANVDGTGVRELTPGLSALDWVDWSPDGSQIAVLAATTNGKGHELEIVSADGSSTRTIALPVLGSEVSWMPPAGQELVFRTDWQQDPTAERGIFAVRPDGSGFRRLPTPGVGPDRDYRGIAMSPDGSLLTYQDSDADAFRVHVVDLRSGTDRVLPHPSRVGQLGGGFSPDGKSMVYLRWEADGQFRAVVAPVDGSSMGTELGPEAPFGPDGPTINNYGFSPDGASILANYDDEKVERLLPVDGSAPTVIARGDLAFSTWQRLAP